VAPESMKVLVVDDDPEQLEMMERQLRSFGVEVRTWNTGIGVTNAVREFGPDVVLLDVNIPALSGDRLVKLLRRSQTSSRLVLFSSNDQDSLRRLAADVGADDWIQKGIDPQSLVQRLQRVCR